MKKGEKEEKPRENMRASGWKQSQKGMRGLGGKKQRCGRCGE